MRYWMLIVGLICCHVAGYAQIKVGAERTELYMHILQNKRVALMVNQTARIGNEHLVDSLLQRGIDIKKVFAPEHGFRGQADAGEVIKDGKDIATGLPIVSLYGSNKKPTPEQLADVDIVVFDIQDVGARFYTYISSMHYVMEACAELGKRVLVLDRPNPNGHYIDGPILQAGFESFVGMHPIPVVHGCTVGELARMINGEHWLAGNVICKLEVIPCLNYTHNTHYELPVKPSPNLPNARSIALYPALCFFEGTAISIGRGTQQQFQIVGHPSLNLPFTFTPSPQVGAKHPKLNGKTCKGMDLTQPVSEFELDKNRMPLSYLLYMYMLFPEKDLFFTNEAFFDKLAGTDQLRRQIMNGLTLPEIQASWEVGLKSYKEMRAQYLLYP